MKNPLLTDISSLLAKWFKNPRLLSAEQDKFQSNVCLFVEAKTGRKGLNFQQGIQMLREMSVVKNEQFKILYEEIEKQRTEITLQQQIITCLEYRHVLKNLPNRKHEVIVKKDTDATSLWKVTWKLAVESELENMIKDHIISNIQEPGSGSQSDHTSSSFRPLIQRDFNYWANKKLSQATSLEGSHPGTKHDLFHLRRYNPLYHEWSIYQRGLTLYNELSSTIHQYGKSYKVYENNWAKSDRLIFKWLKPDINTIEEVNWDREWLQRGLPSMSSHSSERKKGEGSKTEQNEEAKRIQDNFSNNILDANEDVDLGSLFVEGWRGRWKW